MSSTHDFLMRMVVNPLPVPVTKGQRGDWRIDTFTLTDEQIGLSNLRAARDGNYEMLIKPGTYTRLVCKDRGVVMSNTPMEVKTNSEFIARARGRVMINGLGLGMVLKAVLEKDTVESVVVYEIDPDVIALVGPAFQSEIGSGRLSIRQADCHTYKPAKGEQYDVIWHDVWDDISAGNLPQMTALKRKWARRCMWQGCWSQEMAQREKRKWG